MAFDRKLRDLQQVKREQTSRRLYPTAEGVSIVLLLAALLLYSLPLFMSAGHQKRQ